MTPRKNISASVNQRLLNLARGGKRTFHELLQNFAMERVLYRLSQSTHADEFVLKGALLLRVWALPGPRSTFDIDLLGRTKNDTNSIVDQIKDILRVKVEPDGLIFETDSIKTEQITKGAEYEGIRIRLLARLDSAKIPVQIDIGFGDVVYPGFESLCLPTVLDFHLPRILCYSRESAIAEKFEAMVKLGILNSRMKDFYDVWLLSRQFNFKGSELAKAIELTFEKRGTELTSENAVFTEAFWKKKQLEWTAFWSRLQQDDTPESFEVILTSVSKFLLPITTAITALNPMPELWIAPGPWT